MERRRAGRWIAIAAGGLVIAGLGFAIGALIFGWGPGGSTSQSAYSSGGATAGVMGVPEGERSSLKSTEAYDAAAQSPTMDAKAAPTAAGVDPMVVRNAAMEVRVRSMEDAVASVRRIAAVVGAQVTQLSITSGDNAGPRPLGEAAVPSPATGWITLRVPAEKLDTLQQQLAKTGKVLSQSVSADDVTQEYIDLSARLKNLKAEEARLRAFLTKTNKVSELLEVERELARVRGEIEAMQAQVDYLERQAAMATLTLTLYEPGPVVSSGGADWGFADAIRRGIQGAAAVVTGLLTFVIAVAPLLLLALLVWLAVRWLLHRRRPKATLPDAASVAPDDEEGSTE